eukprot:TRINITY_DN14295_c0_g1_i1.p3 TRINITY_DN14295_c0_g1~~TRINITY_DN14295_c0_g1_i1.p3  ORF type:complete len:58 (+),score=4.61 TRINITY_DN14295_c0_g1_i1:160-333(+)
MYYRLLQHDVHEAARVVNCPKVIVDVLWNRRKLLPGIKFSKNLTRYRSFTANILRSS